MNASPLPVATLSNVEKARAMLHPRNIVIVGVTDKPGNYAKRIWDNLVKYGYAGGLYPVNAKRDTIWGVKCHADFAALPEPPDHVIILVPARFVEGVLREAAKAGARSATIVTAGFSENRDEESLRLAAELETAIRETGLGVTGPNCLGNLSTPERLFTNIDHRNIDMTPGKVAIVGQSGAVVMNIRQGFNERGIDCRYMVTTGNEAGLTTSDFMAYYAEDPEVGVIAVYLEGLRDPATFFAACRTARANSKPIVLLKLGTSEGGRAAAMAHTGALTGSIETFDAVVTRAGVVRVKSIDDMIETVECLVHAPRPKGGRIAAITLSGGRRGLLIDAAHAIGVSFPEPGAATHARLAAMLGPGSIVGNPLDAGFAAVVSPSVYIDAIKVMLDDPDIDIVMAEVEIPKAPADVPEATLAKVDAMAKAAGKPMIYYSVFTYGFNPYAIEVRRRVPHLAFLTGVEKCVAAVKSLIHFSGLPKQVADIRSGSTPQMRAALEQALANAKGVSLDEVASKALLHAYGIAVSQEEIATTAEQAVAIAERTGFPVVAKVVSEQILHKSDIGGVILNLTSAQAVRNAFDALVAKVKTMPDAPELRGILIAQQIKGDIELVLGGSHDPEVGPVVLFGTGGIDIELTKDVAIAGAPLDETGARDLIDRTKAGIRIKGYRGRPALHAASVSTALVALSNLMADAGGRIASIDVNPFMLGDKGGVAVDALVVLDKPQDFQASV